MPGKKPNIEIDHFLKDGILNERCPEEGYQALYVNVVVDDMQVNFRSRISEFLSIYRGDINRISNYNSNLKCSIMEGFFTDDFLNLVRTTELFPLFHLMRDEIETIVQIINLKVDERTFEPLNLEKDYRIYTSEVAAILDDEIKAEYVNQLHKIFLNSINVETERHLFRIANFLIHFINWENKFSNFYKSTYELMNDDFELIESHLTKELRMSIKAYSAFHDQINILERFFTKRELGKISTLSYIDWVQSIKDIFQSRLNVVYGQRQAIEFVVTLDSILDKRIRK